jgi:replication factor C small subunit
MLWTEKYRPTSLNQIVGQERFVEDAKAWVYDSKKPMPNVLLYGQAGVGKTAAAVSLANEILEGQTQGNFFEVNASDDRRLEVVRTTIKEIASTVKIGDVAFKIILLDEMDGMTADAQNALRRLMERYSENVRFIITCNQRHKIIYPLQSRCANYLFTPLSNDLMYDVLQNVLDKEEIYQYGENEIRTFIYGFDGDLRRAITELQAATASKTPLTMQINKMLEPYDQLVTSILNKQYESSLSKCHDMIALSVDMKTLCVGLHDSVLNKEMDNATKFKLLRVIGEAEWRSGNMTPKVLVSWMIGQMI